MIKKDKKSFIDEVLNHLKEKSVELLDLSVKILLEPNKFIRENSSSLYRDSSQRYISRDYYNFKRSSYFVFKDNEFYLSSRGRIEIIKKIIKEKREVKKWDGKWRAIIFDIPENRRNQRNFLRKELKWIGFKELQHSIWIIPHDIERELLCLMKLWHIDFTGDIRFLVAEKIIGDDDFREVFFPQK